MIVLIDHYQIGPLAGIADAVKNALRIFLVRYVPGFYSQLIHAGPVRRADPPFATSPDAIATSATVPLAVRK